MPSERERRMRIKIPPGAPKRMRGTTPKPVRKGVVRHADGTQTCFCTNHEVVYYGGEGCECGAIKPS
jgi:hypothetical protein